MEIVICHENKDYCKIINKTIGKISYNNSFKDIHILSFYKPQEFLWFLSSHKNIDLLCISAEKIWLEDTYKIKKENMHMKIVIFANSFEDMIPAFYKTEANSFIIQSLYHQEFLIYLNKLLLLIDKNSNTFIYEKNNDGLYKINKKDIIYI